MSSMNWHTQDKIIQELMRLIKNEYDAVQKKKKVHLGGKY